MSHAATTVNRSVVGAGKWLLSAWVPIMLVVCSIVLSGWWVHERDSYVLSPNDEWLAVDYMYKVPEHLWVHQGEIVGEQARMLDSCYGVAGIGKAAVPCGGDYSKLDGYAQKSISSASGYTPLYFAPTWAVGEAIHKITGLSELNAWRWAGFIWLGLALVLMWVLARRLAIPDIATFALGLILMGSPFSITTFTFLNTDATGPFIGILLILLAQDYLRGRRSGWWLVGAGALATALKATNIMAVGAVIVYLLIAWLMDLREGMSWQGRWRARRPKAPNRYWIAVPLFAIATLAAAGGFEVAWDWFQNLTAVGPLPVQGLATTPLDKLSPITVLRSGLQLVGSTIMSGYNFASGDGKYALPSDFTSAFSWLTAAGVIGAFLAAPLSNKKSALVVSDPKLAISTFAATFLGFPALGLLVVLQLHLYYWTPPRYGACLLALMLISLGMLVKSRTASWTLFAFGAGWYIFLIAEAHTYA